MLLWRVHYLLQVRPGHREYIRLLTTGQRPNIQVFIAAQYRELIIQLCHMNNKQRITLKFTLI